jgi:hypothetical protein
MKNFITFALLLTILCFGSCKKKTTAPESTTTTTLATTDLENKTIKIQYRVSAASGQVNVQYTFNDGGDVKTITTTVSRLTFSYSFEWKKGEKLSLHAYNTKASDKAVTVEIYVDGVLFKTGQTNASGGVASAEGIYN